MMISRLKLLASMFAATCPTALVAQAHTATGQSAPTVQPQTPAKTKTTTTTTSTATAVPDEAGNTVAVQKTTDTTQTTTTQPPGSPPAAKTTSTTTVAPDATGTPPATTTTTTTEPTKDQTGAAVTAATAADVKAGVPVFDAKGGVVGKVESVDAKGAVVNTGKVKASVPVASFGKNDKGLVISMTKAELDAAAKTAAPKKK